MIRKWFGFVLTVAIAAALLNVSSCARNQKLQGITVSPATYTFFTTAVPGVAQIPVPLTAYGSFIHPPQNKDITSQVTWSSSNSLVAAVTSTGQLTAGTLCGVADITATGYSDGTQAGSIVVGSMTTTVEGPTSLGCPPETATNNLSVNVTAGSADGSVVSSPSGINCGSTCAAAFQTGSTVAVTASGLNGHNFLGWTSGCTSVSGNTCSVKLNTDVVVSGSFD